MFIKRDDQSRVTRLSKSRQPIRLSSDPKLSKISAVARGRTTLGDILQGGDTRVK